MKELAWLAGLVLVGPIGCACSQPMMGDAAVTHDTGASSDVSLDGGRNATDASSIDATDASNSDAADAGTDAHDAQLFDAELDVGTDEAGCPVSQHPDVPCLGQLVLRPGTLEGAWNPQGPIRGSYVDAYASGAGPTSPGSSAMLHIDLDLTSVDASRMLEGFPLTAGGADNAVAREGVNAVAVDVVSGVDRLIALYDIEGSLLAPMIPEPAGLFEVPSFDVGCQEVRVVANGRMGSCGTTLEGRIFALDGRVLEDTRLLNWSDTYTVFPQWRGAGWVIAGVPLCDSTSSPYVVTLAPDGTSSARRVLPFPSLAATPTYRFNQPEVGDWSLLTSNTANELTYARFDPETGAVVVTPRIVGTVGVMSALHGVREAGGTDAYMFVETYATFDSRWTLLRIRSDGSVLQRTELARTDFLQVNSMRWLSDRLVVGTRGSSGEQTSVLTCAP